MRTGISSGAGQVRTRLRDTARELERWRELMKFCVVGAAGYLVNLGIYTLLVHGGIHYLPAAVASFAVAVTNNYTWNRVWTFRQNRGDLYDQGLRFLTVSLASLGGNLLLLHGLVDVHVAKLPAQAIAIVLVMPFNFLGSKLWAFGRLRAAAAR
jgi:putative flippase GtrA